MNMIAINPLRYVMTKKIILSFLLCLFIITKSLCQDWCDTVITNIKGKKLLSQIQPEIGVINNKAYYYSSNRVQEFGVRVFFDVCPSDAFVKTGEKDSAYLLKIYSKNDTIFLIDISVVKTTSPKGNPQWIQKFSRIDSAMARNLLKLHNEKYSSEWQLSDYFKNNYYLSKGDSIVSYKVYLAALVKKRNHEELDAWASFLDPNIRAWGTVGLYLLRMDGEKLTQSEENLIVLNSSSNLIIDEIGEYFSNFQDVFGGSKEMYLQLRSEMMNYYYSMLKQQNLL